MTERRGNFFSLPNEIFLLGLSPSAFLVYSYLRRSANRETHQCYPSYGTIGSAVGLSRNTVQKCVCALVDKGLISTENTSVITRDGLKCNGSLMYTICPAHEVVEDHYRQQLQKLQAQSRAGAVQKLGRCK